MLQHNTQAAGARRAHWAHAAVVGVHVLCCGLPAAFALFGVALGALAWAAPIAGLHHSLHGYEAEILVFSAGMVALGGVLEWRQRASRRSFSKLYALSLACFLANAGLVGAHWLTPEPAQAAQVQTATR